MRAGAPRDAHSGVYPQARGIVLACPAVSTHRAARWRTPSLWALRCGPRPEPMDGAGSSSGWGPTPLTLGLAQMAEGHPDHLLSVGPRELARCPAPTPWPGPHLLWGCPGA